MDSKLLVKRYSEAGNNERLITVLLITYTRTNSAIQWVGMALEDQRHDFQLAPGRYTITLSRTDAVSARLLVVRR